MNKIGLIKILLFNDSRKVGLGLWIFFPTLFVYLISFAYSIKHPPLVGSPTVGITYDQFMLAATGVGAFVFGATVKDKSQAMAKMKIEQEGCNDNKPA